MKTLLLHPAQIITIDSSGQNYLRGDQFSEIDVLENHSILIENKKILDFIPNSLIVESRFNIINVKDKVISPGLIDCHTHTVFAGSRSDEFRLKLAGVGYEEIANSGGGIIKTVNAVHNASFTELIEISKPRIDYFISQGITSMEIKSGYGLSVNDEIKMLQVINYLDTIYPIEIIPTFLGAHTFPVEYKNHPDEYIDLILNNMLPQISEKRLARFCDVFCEKTAFSPSQTDLIFQKASSLGMKLKLHTEQFNNIGGIEVGLKNDVQSIEHLEMINEKDITNIAVSNCVCVLLPGVSFSLRYQYAPARKLISNNAIIALASDYNPGSSHIANLSLIMGLAAVEMKMNFEEILSAFTLNAAKALDISERCGSIEIGKQADFAIFNTNDYNDILYNIGKNLNVMTIKNGKVIYKDDRVF
jgi:imidazolonepropionase